jgi:hypothetical protein
MTDSIVSTLSRFLTPEVVGKIATASGIDRSLGQTAVDACVPAMLRGLADLAASPGGARQLANAVAEQPVGLLGSLGSLFQSSAQTADKGTSLLTSLLGGGALGTMVSSVARFAGINEGSARTMIGLLTPVVLGVLGREQRGGGFDAGGLARMLTEQKDQIAAAMPSGLSDLLPSKSWSDMRRTYDPPRAATAPAMHRMVGDHKPAVARSAWPYWVLPLLAAAGLLWFMLPRMDQPARTTSAPAAATPGEITRLTSTPDSRLAFLARPADGWTPLSAYYKQDIYNRAGEKLGSIKELLVGSDGRINAAVISVGQFLGLGEKDIAVPFSVLRPGARNTNQPVVLDVLKEALQSAPAFEHSGIHVPGITPQMPRH